MEKFDINRAVSSYSGQIGKCCCGCAGKHTTREENERAVLRAAKRLASNPNCVVLDDLAYVETETRQNIVYFTH